MGRGITGFCGAVLNKCPVVFHVFVGLCKLLCGGLCYSTGVGLLLYLSIPSLIHLLLWVTVLAMSFGAIELPKEGESEAEPVQSIQTDALPKEGENEAEPVQPIQTDAPPKEEPATGEPRARGRDYNVEAFVGLYAIAFVHICLDVPPSWHPVLLSITSCLSVLSLTAVEALLIADGMLGEGDLTEAPRSRRRRRKRGDYRWTHKPRSYAQLSRWNLRLKKRNYRARWRYRRTHKSTLTLAKRSKKFMRQMQEFEEEERKAAEELAERKTVLRTRAEDCARHYHDNFSVQAKKRTIASLCLQALTSKHGAGELLSWEYSAKPLTCRQILDMRARRKAAHFRKQQRLLDEMLAAIDARPEGAPDPVVPVEVDVERPQVDDIASEGAKVTSSADAHVPSVDQPPDDVPGVRPPPAPDPFDSFVEREVAFALYLEDGSFDKTEGRFHLDTIEDARIDAFCRARGSTDSFLAATRLTSKMVSRRHQESAEDTVARAMSYRLRLAVCRLLNNSHQHVKPRPTSTTCPLIYDTGASFGLTPFRSDFIDYVECQIQVRDISKSNTVVGIGTTLHRFTSSTGEPFWLPCLSYHLPSSEVRLFSPQTYHTIYGGKSCVEGDHVDIFLDKHTIPVPIDRETANVPMVHNSHVTPVDMKRIGPHVRSALPAIDRRVDLFSGLGVSFASDWKTPLDDMTDISDELFGYPSVHADSNVNLTDPQKHLLLWMNRLGIGGKRVQELMRAIPMEERDGKKSMSSPVLPPYKSSSSCPVPLDQTALLAKAKRRTPKVSRRHDFEEKEGILSREHLTPGDSVAVDQYVVKTPGRTPTGFGNSTTRFNGGTIFRDSASKAIFVENQVTLGAGETVLSKSKFEQWLWELAARKVKHYHSDNGVFKAKEFRKACDLERQSQSFSGVDAQFQNAEAERAIQTIIYMARYYMIHAAVNWGCDGTDDMELWPFAVDHAAYVYNLLPQRSSGLTPLEFLSSIRSDHSDLRRLHVWGCPVYVLDPKLAGGKKIPKWNRRARMGQFLGYSSEHSSQVGLVRHLKTGHISPQWHLVFDDKFETVYSSGQPTAEVDKICTELFESGRELYAEDEFDDDGILIYQPPPLDDIWLTHGERIERRAKLESQRLRSSAREKAAKARIRTIDADLDDPDGQSVSFDDSATDLDSEGDMWIDHRSTREPDVPPQPPVTPPSDALGRGPDGRSRRLACATGPRQVPQHVRRALRDRLSFAQRMRSRRTLGDLLLETSRVSYRRDNGSKASFHGMDVPSVEYLMDCPLSNFIHLAAKDCGYSGSRKDIVTGWIHPLFLKARAEASKEDNPSWNKAMTGDFKEDFWKAAEKEIETLEKEMGAWEVVDRPADANVLQSIWAFKIKRYPDGLIKKFKARFCARGDQQLEGVDYFETYAPVVQWTTIRLMLTLEVLLKLKSKQGDVTAAFLHATLDPSEKIYMEMPLGFRQKGKVLKLNKSIYGLRQSSREFWKYLTDIMESCDMQVSKVDPCLFASDKVIAVAYVDDLLFWAKDEADIVALTAKLRAKGLLLEPEDDAAGFLGVRLHRHDDGRIEMRQTGLIDRIVEALGLDVATAKKKLTPATSEPLIRDEDGEPMEADFNYASVVGMMLYLSGHSRPDITYAVNCCARYMFLPRKRHEVAIKRIGRYLKATRDKGMILNPSSELRVDCYPDADFAGLYGYESPTDPSCVRSRTGFVITVANCPVLWVSRLQESTALSTMQAEVNALAHSCRELFPIMDLVEEVGAIVGLPTEDLTSMHVSIHEDNAGALALAQAKPPQFTASSKYYAIKTVWWRQECQRRGISILKIETADQLGDMFTKGLVRPLFEHLRKKLMGW